jgi:uncharacterized protein (TIRG00374 family)
MIRKRAVSRRLLIAAGVILSLGLLGFFASGHFGALRDVGTRVQWWAVGAGLLCAAGSYAMVGLALGEVLGVLGHALPFSAVQGIALVSTTANYFVSSGGVSGFALKAHLLRKRHVPYGATVTASVVSSAILYFVLAVIIAQGLAYLILRMRGADVPLLEGVVGLSVVLVSSVTLMRMVFDHELRGRVTGFCFHAVNHVAFWFSKAQIPREEFIEFEAQLAAGLEKVRAARGRLLRTILYTALDWGLALLTLHFCFRAVGVLLPFGELSAGFTIGMAATLIPVLPGGLGAMEGGMAAVYEALGVGWEAAFMAVLLYRLCYYLIPGLASMFVLWGLKVSET